MTSLRPITRRRRARGFTLTELMVSLVMGLVVALASVALARTATTTFHEQVRSSTTEMSLRMASERLKQDLMRVSYMSTGNIVLDPKVAQMVNNGASTASRFPATNTLRGISIDVAMVATPGKVPASIANNGITPDAIDLVGNFTTDDSYNGVIDDTPAPGCAAAQTITLNPQGDAAVYALSGGTGGTVVAATLLANATNAFMPPSTPVAAHQYLAQVTDDQGCTNYVPVCNVNTSIGKDGLPRLTVSVDGRGVGHAVLYRADGNIDHQCGSGNGRPVTIAPLSHVRWSIVPSQTNLANTAAIDGDGKFDLVREVFDFDGLPLGIREVIAEYAVDLKFGIVADDPNGVAAARQAVFDLDTDDGTGNIFKTTSVNSTDTVKVGKFLGPQRVRSVRYRISVRTGVADRDQDLAIDAGPIKARYCIDFPGCKQYARVRTVTSEVALENQVGMFY